MFLLIVPVLLDSYVFLKGFSIENYPPLLTNHELS